MRAKFLETAQFKSFFLDNISHYFRKRISSYLNIFDNQSSQNSRILILRKWFRAKVDTFEVIIWYHDFILIAKIKTFIFIFFVIAIEYTNIFVLFHRNQCCHSFSEHNFFFQKVTNHSQYFDLYPLKILCLPAGSFLN